MNLGETQRWLLREMAVLGAVLLLIGWLAGYGLTFRWAWEEAPASADTSGAALSVEPIPALPPDDLPARTFTRGRLAGTPALRLPVAGVRPDDLTDTFDDARSGGREHQAIDILAPHGTPVLAAADGGIVRLHRSVAGGRSIYQLSADSSRVYYYAHLARYAEGLREGRRVQRGDTLAYVGTSGNAPDGTPHLHFAVWIVTDPDNFWDGLPVNPYPLLTSGS